jgi:regulator of replication initiation timing
VRIKRQEQMDEMQVRLQSITQQNARLLQHTAALEQQRQLLMSQLGMLRDKFTDKATEAAQLRAQLEQLTRALQSHGGNVAAAANAANAGASPREGAPQETARQGSGGLVPASNNPSLPVPPTPDANGFMGPGGMLTGSVFAQHANPGMFPPNSNFMLGGNHSAFAPLATSFSGFNPMQGLGSSLNLSGLSLPPPGPNTSSSPPPGHPQHMAPSSMPLGSQGMPPPSLAPQQDLPQYDVTVNAQDNAPGKISEKAPSISFFLAQ